MYIWYFSYSLLATSKIRRNLFMAKPITVKSSLSSWCWVGSIPTTYRSSGHAGFLEALHQACVKSVFILHCWGSDWGCAQRIAEPLQTLHCLGFLLITCQENSRPVANCILVEEAHINLKQPYHFYTRIMRALYMRSSHLETTFLSLGLS